MASPLPNALLGREESVGQKFERLLSENPLRNSTDQNSVLIAIGTSLGITAALFVGFLLLRPFNTVVYAPRLRHADEKHRPPPLDKSILAWWNPIFKTNEIDFVHQIGLDATIFLRFARMCRNMFIVLATVGCLIIIPVNITHSLPAQKDNSQLKSMILNLMTPEALIGPVYWWFVAVAYIFDIIVCGFLWWTYRAVHRLKRNHMESAEYQNSLHARTLMITDIRKDMRSDQGLVEIIDTLHTTPEIPRASIGRNVKDVPDMIEEHEKAVMELEDVLAKYLKNPNQLPATRPLCMPSKNDPGYTDKKQKVDAIDYLTARIQRLETKIKEVRETIDKRDAMRYGFASYEQLESAHIVAYSVRNKHPKGTTVQLAPRPKDIIWKNLPLEPKTRRWRKFVNQLWIMMLTFLYFVPNAAIAIFMSKLSNLVDVWPAFGVELGAHPKWWAFVQGIGAPALTSLIYYFLPIIFRRLSTKAGDLTKTSREQHVISQLYVFFVFNNLFMFSLFGATFGLIFKLVALVNTGQAGSFWDIKRELEIFHTITVTLCQVSPYWITWLVQRNLGAAIDLAQVINLAWGSFSRKFLSPTPRSVIVWSAPPPFDYTNYYNYFLFYSTVALCFGPLQPLTMVVIAFYFSIDSWMKKYLLMYVFCTKNESGGAFWRVLFNRMLVGAFLSNCLIALMVSARALELRYTMLGAMVPLPLFLLGFKIYCHKKFADTMKYYTKGTMNKGAEAATPIDKESRKRDRVAVRFGHPALYQKLIVPMVSERSKHLLSEVYRGRLDSNLGDSGAFSDVYAMKHMSIETPGKPATTTTSPFEFVSESNMDFENFKNRPEFRDEFGGEGSIYGPSNSRPGTPSTIMTRGRPMSRDASQDSERMFDGAGEGVIYPTGYHHASSHLREYSDSPGPELRRSDSDGQGPLLRSAAPMGDGAGAYTPYSPDREGGREYFR